MKTSIVLVMIFLYCLSAKAQAYKRVIIHAGDNLTDYFTFRFPSFEEATILLRNGGSLISKLNYNTLICKMEFIDPNGDTLQVAKPETTDSIKLKYSTFFLRMAILKLLLRLILSN